MSRPAKFDRDLVLERAMQAFWDQGYCSTSVATLTQTTQLNPGSIYAAFESKQGLFLATLDHYGKRSVEEITQTVNSAETPLEGIRELFRQLATNVKKPKSERSCFLVNTVLDASRHNAMVRERVNHYFDLIESVFRNALASAQNNGELAIDKNPRTLATFIMTTIWGLRVLLVTGAGQDKVESVLDQLFILLD
ncbi:MAG: TetR/AcrR family transcriptional regulator [Candidatus Thiodiazotropha sp. (ex Myrtea sp. 'scaly one' KF741663)]|nr:TetR/AcrR family transcriptional regulator [Candidatus Thiodiazotropha sp. (ex Myrtea sp. 'scaly one' KF741663)]